MSAIHSISNRDFDALGVEVDVGIVKTMQEDRIPLGLQSPKMLFKIGMDTENEKWGGRGRCVWRKIIHGVNSWHQHGKLNMFWYWNANLQKRSYPKSHIASFICRNEQTLVIGDQSFDEGTVWPRKEKANALFSESPFHKVRKPTNWIAHSFSKEQSPSSLAASTDDVTHLWWSCTN